MKTIIRRQHENETETDLNTLPYVIISEILSRVPAKTVFCCMTVSKPWLSLINNPFCAKELFLRSSVRPLLVFDGICESVKPGRIITHLVEGENASDFDPDQIGKSKLSIEFRNVLKLSKDGAYGPFLPRNDNVTSCEGLICYALQPYSGGHDHAFVCNPVTGEYVTLNLGCTDMADEEEKVSVFIGLGFSRVDKRFKLLRISKLKSADATVLDSWWPELCFVETGGWQRVKVPSVPHKNFSKKISEVIYVNGGIYWRYRGDALMYFFDFDSVLFEAIPLPDMNGLATHHSSLGVLSNALCVSLISNDDKHEYVELWTMQNTSEEHAYWRKILDFQYLDSRKHIRMIGDYMVIRYLDQGKVLLHDKRGTFFIYDPITKTERSFLVLNYKDSFCDLGKERLNLKIVPHVPSFTSLRDALNMEDERVATVPKKYPRISSRGTGTRS